jgi:catechol 2,3-dioxygenase-like lactoylglutathione lyase family enzyme
MARHSLTAILPCNDLDKSQAFYARLGFSLKGGDANYCLLEDGKGGQLHLHAAVEGWLVPGRNHRQRAPRQALGNV